ncbi:hypothetical protein OGAPHI_006816 [Ogataea philodendri]|uniref:Uncharacterized protein n=1 Tax=Ogataea philodendri TaxID=1378263 RepID=A0A9P8NYI6_9ASCO|nr:uncharacterized protein OGAPHI_006816 [Ogataea philodendri]KAH3661409.1 hypothetical protein OGAPHI_006816 [Ogataea philodendri]
MSANELNRSNSSFSITRSPWIEPSLHVSLRCSLTSSLRSLGGDISRLSTERHATISITGPRHPSVLARIRTAARCGATGNTTSCCPSSVIWPRSFSAFREYSWCNAATKLSRPGFSSQCHFRMSLTPIFLSINTGETTSDRKISGSVLSLSLSPESTTYLIPGTVMDVSAILVAKITLRWFGLSFLNTSIWTCDGSAAYSGTGTKIGASLGKIGASFASMSTILSMSSCPDRKHKISPVGSVWLSCTTVLVTVSTISSTGCGKYRRSTGYIRPSTKKIGALLKNCENLSASSVADMMITWNWSFCRLLNTRSFRNPSNRSVRIVRS